MVSYHWGSRVVAIVEFLVCRYVAIFADSGNTPRVDPGHWTAGFDEHDQTQQKCIDRG